MFKKLNKIALVAAAAVFALPGVANAGTATATGTASLTVVNQCSVTGATVNLGTFLASSTWASVAAELGHNKGGGVIVTGTRGTEYLTWGSVTCDNGMAYTLSIAGTSGRLGGAIKMIVGGKEAVLTPHVKKIGAIVQTDDAWSGTGFGAFVGGSGRPPATGTGTGTAQAIVGAVQFHQSTSIATLTDALTVGVYSDTLTYTLNF